MNDPVFTNDWLKSARCRCGFHNHDTRDLEAIESSDQEEQAQQCSSLDNERKEDSDD